jgi:hypothetical protein
VEFGSDFAVGTIIDALVRFATTPFKGKERNNAFSNIRSLPVHFWNAPKITRWARVGN